MSGIEVRQLKKQFGAFIAVNDVDLEAKSGEMLTLLGPSGCGKTTTLRMIAGLEEPSGGVIRAGTRTIYDSAKRTNVPTENRGLGMVFQSYAIWPHMTVAENVAFPLKMRGVPKNERTDLVRDVLKMVGLDGLESKSATRLSGGQQQRIAFARALVFKPDLLLLDEPLSNLDAKLREHMRFELKMMKRDLDVTSIYVTHDQEEALTLSDRIVVMNRGRVEQIGTPEEIYDQPATRFVADFIGKANMIALAPGAVSRNGEAAVDVPTFDGPLRIVVRKERIRAENGAGAASSASVSAGHLFIRPEKISLCSERSGEGNVWIPGRIRDKAYVGDRHDILVDINDAVTVRVSAPTGAGWSVGDTAYLGFAERDLALYV